VIAGLGQATVMMGVPTFYTRLLDNPAFTRELADGVRVFICGSAPLLPSTFAEFEARSGQRILERYGMSEAVIITTNPLDGDRIAGSVGYPLPGVAESAVIGLPHPDFGEGVAAIVIGEGAEADMIAAARAQLAAYKAPKRILFVDELPRNAMGKVQKNLLRQQYADLFRGA